VIVVRREAQGGREFTKVSAGFEVQLVPRTVLHGQVDVALCHQRRCRHDIQPFGIAAYAIPGISFECGLLRIRVRDCEPHLLQSADSRRPERIQPGQRARWHEHPGSGSSALCDEPLPEGFVGEASPARCDQRCA